MAHYNRGSYNRYKSRGCLVLGLMALPTNVIIAILYSCLTLRNNTIVLCLS